MSKLSALALGLGLAITTTISAIAAPTLSIQIFDGATLIGSVTNVAGGSASTLASDANFSNIIVSAQGVPVLPTPNLSSISINATSAAATTHTLTVKVTQTGLTAPIAVLLGNTFTGNTLTGPNFTTFTIANYYDSTNTAFGTGTLMATADYSNLGSGSFSTGPIAYSATPGALWSETSIYTITFIGANQSISASAQIINVPEPMSLALFGAALLGMGGLARRSRNQG